MDVVQVTSAISVFFLKSQEPVYRLALRAPGTVRAVKLINIGKEVKETAVDVKGA